MFYMARYLNAGTYKPPAPWQSIFFIPIILLGLSLIAMLSSLIILLVMILSLNPSNDNSITIISLIISYTIGIYFIRKPLMNWINIMFKWIIRKKGNNINSIIIRGIKLFILVFIEIPIIISIIWFTLFIILGIGHPDSLAVFNFENFNYLTLFTYRIGIYLLILIPFSSFLIEKYLPEKLNNEINQYLRTMED